MPVRRRWRGRALVLRIEPRASRRSRAPIADAFAPEALRAVLARRESDPVRVGGLACWFADGAAAFSPSRAARCAAPDCSSATVEAWTLGTEGQAAHSRIVNTTDR